ncbi:methyltransferase domain-containing protein [Alkalimonas amylolytica]|uniref:Malonyl-CoA O-methyltransferase n=1 Tax=Alkalimonas amylolytica TaxID=152573 RepID=A0A1H3ZA92_ALKAM|nr:methyltransferase domain-containing protein [Alkalimonas amylolytica]SEA20242.1 malonyl-CoA O-methyltransferase [Alkalimonas amylolytica]
MSVQAHAIARHFGKACQSYSNAARLQRLTGYAILNGLPAEPRGCLLDLGCGPAWLHPELVQRGNTLLAVDLSAGMLHQARQLGLAKAYIQADAAALPLPPASVRRVFSNLMLQWCPKPGEVAAELERVLQSGGTVNLSTLLHGTLAELRQAFLALKLRPHVNQFLTAEALLLAMQQGAPTIDWQLQSETVQFSYPDVLALGRELKSLGANYVPDKERKGLTGRSYWQQLQQAYPKLPGNAQAGYLENSTADTAADTIIASYQVAYLTGVKR